MSRTVTVLLTHEGEEYGAIGPFPVDSPYWANVEPVVEHVRAVVGVPVVVLRLVDVVGGTPPRGGHVLYHAEALDRPRLRTGTTASDAFGGVAATLRAAGFGTTLLDGLIAPEPRRASYATAEGVRAALAWADDAAERAGYRRIGPPEQVKTWNLSAVFRLPVAAGEPLWLKLTRAFAAHEPAVTALVGHVDASLVPVVVGSDPAERRVLLTHIPGEDCWDASADLMAVTIDRWSTAQAALASALAPALALLPGSALMSVPQSARRLPNPDVLALSPIAALTHISGPASTQGSRPAPTKAFGTNAFRPAPTQASGPAPTQASGPAPTNASGPAPTQAFGSAVASAPVPAFVPGLVPDRRPATLAAELGRLLAGATGTQLSAPERDAAAALAAELPGIVEALAACGLPETLVHGDFHPGNWRADPVGDSAPVLLDFADAYVGHPAFDGVRLRDFVAPAYQAAVTEAWCRAWTARIPGSDPARALELATPLQHIAGAALYAMFLDNIEPSERRYHEDDPVAEIRAAIGGRS